MAIETLSAPKEIFTFFLDEKRNKKSSLNIFIPKIIGRIWPSKLYLLLKKSLLFSLMKKVTKNQASIFLSQKSSDAFGHRNSICS
jgi:hypothetical protein